ncbi:MAG TPA: nucleotidyltransferase domain-containing protein [Candidatus Nanoarchaeia archaeon]|nr:nucleotidyltransferase domain-containing protein [Candidatus Nanoarchaeia archaeon]
MKELIKKLCTSLEKEKRIKILFAIENGSRAWRMDSKDSDYDVRFVFARPVGDYIRLKPLKDVIEARYDKNGNPCENDAVIDMSGFDVVKFAQMLVSSNPTAIEWLMSDMVYYGNQNKTFQKFAMQNFNPKALYYHYKSMCKNNYLKYLKSGDTVTHKKYLYAYRGSINAKWVVHKRTVPPIIFSDALKAMKNKIPESILKKVENIIELKAHGKEKDIIQNIVEMDNYIEDFLKNVDEAPPERVGKELNKLNEELRRIILNSK